MAHRWKNDLSWEDVTPEAVWLNRRQLMVGTVGLGLGAIAGSTFASELELNSWDDITSYNNFYEFGTDKGDPKRYAGDLVTNPWQVEIDGFVDRPGIYDFEDIISKMTIEERIYRFRCVEAWSMVIPWSGFELADLLKLAGLQSEARYVAFETLYRPEQMRGQRFPTIKWPYVEGLRLDEAMHPLTILAIGLYQKPTHNHNGATLRLIVTW